MKPTKEELAIINSRLPGSTVTDSQVEVLPFYLFDDLETDRSTVMTPEMLRKIIKDADDGLIAFNAMHQTNYTLPVGRSVQGKIVNQDGSNKAFVKLYTVTTRPDGTPLEDGKELADRYNTGAVYACSAGVEVGFYKCSICGNDIRDWKDCDHFPGETYMVDEKPVKCIAYMTGHNIVDGIAMDCGCYECSAVTAGGVRRASVLTETFSKFSSSMDAKEFKKNEFSADKQLTDFITFMPQHVANEYSNSMPREEVQMDSIKVLTEKNYELISDKAKAEVNLAQLQGKYDVLTGKHDVMATQLAATKAEFEASQAKVVELQTTIDDYAVQLEAFKATDKSATIAELTADMEAYKAGLIALVEANGVRAGKNADYASKSCEEILALNEEYLADIALIPAGQQSLDNDSTNRVEIEHAYVGIPDSMFKTI